MQSNVRTMAMRGMFEGNIQKQYRRCFCLHSMPSGHIHKHRWKWAVHSMCCRYLCKLFSDQHVQQLRCRVAGSSGHVHRLQNSL